MVAALNRFEGGPPRLWVGGEGVARVAVEIARELIEQDQQRQRAVGAQGPVVVLAAGGGMVGRLELQPDRRVERVVLLEPALVSRGAPEVDDVGWDGRAMH